MSVKYSVKFNGIELSNYIYVLEGFTPFVGANWSPEVVTLNGNINGSQFRYQKFIEKEFTMPFSMEADTEAELRTKYDALQQTLNVSEPAQLIFESTPDRYCLAVPLGVLDFEQILDTGEGTIVWLVPDGLAHAITPKTFTASLNDEGILEATIVNGGSVEVPISYEIVNNSDNGYIGIVSEYGAMQYGLVEESDTESYQQSEILMQTEDLFNTPNDEIGTPCAIQYDAVINGDLGSIPWSTAPAKKWLELTNDGSGSLWHGGQRTFELPEDSEGHVGAKNFTCYVRHWFQCRAANEHGFQSFALLDEENRVIAGMNIYKLTANNGNSHCNMMANGKWVKYFEFICNDTDDNPFREDNGHDAISKEGDIITFYFKGIYYPIMVPELKDSEVKKVQVTILNFGNRTQITRNYIGVITFTKNNVDKLRDVPNRYSTGDVININGDKGSVTVNGMPKNGDEIIGTKYFKAPPGITKVEIYRSEWAEEVNAKAMIREAYL